MKKYLSQPKIQLILTLIPILAVAIFFQFNQTVIVNTATIILSAIVFDFLFLKLRKNDLFFPSAAIVTGLIISLIIDPQAPIYVALAASGAAMFSKNCLRFPRHIFNPAAFGILFIAIVFSSSASWWGPSALLGSPLFLLVFLPGLVSAYRMKRYYTIVVFFLSYSLIFISQFNTPLVDPTIIFFTLVMAPEPMTTPVKRENQVLFALFLTISIFAFSKLLTGIPIFQKIDPLIFSLLLGNLVFFKRR